MSVMTDPHDSIRTVFTTSGEVSSTGLVRTTYMGVFSIWAMLPLDCSRVPIHARKSGLRLPALLMNSLRPDWMRIWHSEIIVSMTVHSAHANTAWEGSCAWMGSRKFGQICR